jgi:D-alanyl-D-alanine carboxypeptidase
MSGLPPIATVKLTSRCYVSGTAEATTNLKPFEPVALQGVVEATAKKLLLPGAMVLLRTPQDDFAFGYGVTDDLAARRYAFPGPPRTPRR